VAEGDDHEAATGQVGAQRGSRGEPQPGRNSTTGQVARAALTGAAIRACVSTSPKAWKKKAG
jgi:hypothetical protein